MSTISHLANRALTMASNAAKSLVPQSEPQIVDAATLADPKVEKDWTVLVYMEGRDRLAHSTHLALNKMEQVGSSDKVNLVAQATIVPTLGERTFAEMGRTNTRRYYIQQDGDMERVASPVVQDLHEQTRLDQESLTDFLKWGMQNFPAKRYLVVVKKHGAGYAKIGDHVPLSARELQAALKATGKQVDVLAWDSCAMGQMEVAHQLRNEAKVMTGSPEDVYAVDFPYAEILKTLDANPTATTLAQTIVREHAKASPYGIHTAVDLSRTQAFATSMGRLADALVDKQVPRERLYSAMMKASSLEPKESLRFAFNFRDVGGFLENLASDPQITDADVKAALQQARQDLAATKVAHAIDPRKDKVKHSTGTTAFLPWKDPKAEVREGYLELDYAKDAKWGRLTDYLFGEQPDPADRATGPNLSGLSAGQKLGKLALMGYKKYVSPYLGVACPYTPSCSQYTREAIETHGILEGTKLGLMRFLSCSGHGAGGLDPVPGHHHHGHGHDHDHDHDHAHAHEDPAPATVFPPRRSDKSEPRQRLENLAFRAARVAGGLAGGIAGMVAGLPGGLAFGAFVGWKAGTATIDEHNKKLMGKYREQAVRSLIRLERPVGMPAFRIHAKVASLTGSQQAAKAVGGPLGCLVGAVAGALGGAAMGWRWGALFGGLAAQNGTKDLLGELPAHPATEAILDRDYR